MSSISLCLVQNILIETLSGKAEKLTLVVHHLLIPVDLLDFQPLYFHFPYALALAPVQRQIVKTHMDPGLRKLREKHQVYQLSITECLWNDRRLERTPRQGYCA
ncbi:hypothetical protein N7G274_000094 [Stereocaulon virgatum]|uniref:Uncharacterized protein n=1 Tax=Stereocaulon virgatum TaxID=373712 RepID=A0ABR4AST7_9LECA